MKRFSLPAPVLILAVCAALIASANRLYAHDNNVSTAGDGGRLLIKRSPVLGYNVWVTVTIDGKPAGSVRRGQTYEHFLAPGRHVLTVSPNALAGPWRTTLDVRAGEAYSYTVSYHTDKLLLTPSKSR